MERNKLTCKCQKSFTLTNWNVGQYIICPFCNQQCQIPQQLPTKPLRLAIIGLSAKAVTSWASSAHLPGLLSEQGKKHYIITALCNSSVLAAEEAIKVYNFPATTKAYGSPDDLANDPDIDVVVCNVRVDKHYETILPSLKAGKRVYIEWPIAGNLTEIEEIVKIAKEKKSKVGVGLQRPWSPPVQKVRNIIESGVIGKILSSHVKAFGGTNDREILPIGLKYFAQKEVGGNPITIGFAHMIDYVLSVLGDLVPGSTHARTQIQRPTIRVRDPKTGDIVETIQSDVPDLISMHGELVSSSTVNESASLSVYYRRGQQFLGEPAFNWAVNCERGEIRIVGPAGINSSYSDSPTIQIHHFEKDKVEDIEWKWSEEQLVLPVVARNVSSCLYAFAEGNDKGYTSLESAANRARQINAWLEKGAW